MTFFCILLSIAALTGLSYSIVIGRFTYGWFRLKETRNLVSNQNVSVSVIVPFRNEEANLPDILECLKNQSYPPALLEIIFVDDHSEDAGFNLVNQFIKTNHLAHFKLLRLDEGDGISKKAALRKGIEHSSSELIITTDADCTMGESWISSIIAKYDSGKCPMISATVFIRPGNSFFSKLQSLEFLSLIGCGAGAIAINKPFLANGANLAFSRKLYNELRGYSNHMVYASGDDVFMLLQAKKKHNIAFLKDKAAIVYTSGAPNLKTFLYQRMRWASKSTGYKDTTAFTTALIVLLLNFLLLLLIILGFINHNYFYLAFGLFTLKLMIDFPLLNSVSQFFSHKTLMRYYLPMQLLYTVYIIATAALSFLIPFEWKNRLMRK